MTAPGPLTLADVEHLMGSLLETVEDHPMTDREATIVRRYRAVSQWAAEEAAAALAASQAWHAHIEEGTGSTPEALAVLEDGNGHAMTLERLEALDLAQPIAGVDDVDQSP